MNEKAVRQYLQRYAEVEIGLLADWPIQNPYQHVVLLPAYKEPINFLEAMLRATWFQHGVLVILVINQPDTAHDSAPQQTLHDFVVNHSQTLWRAGNLILLAPRQVVANTTSTTSDTPSGHLLLVNRFERPIPAKQGVGLARKIAADLALALIARSMITTQWICSTDADAILPDDYFAALTDVAPDNVAACYDFKHIAARDGDPENSEPKITAATLTYEQAMRYYVAGLRYAGSAYAHFTIGSILAFTASAYARVRGFPKRAAGEDFYLLNKLVKLGGVTRLAATVKLQARLSDRVPFGTGVSTAKIMQLHSTAQPFCYYHPQVFNELRSVINHFDQLWPGSTITGITGTKRFGSSDSKSSTDTAMSTKELHPKIDKFAADTAIDQWLEKLPPSSAQALLALGFKDIAEKLLLQCRDKQQFNRQLTGWFDGLKTLQFIHLLRDSGYPNLPLEHAIQRADFMR